MSKGIPPQLNPNQRRWRDIKLWRLVCGPALAPVIPFGLAVILAEG